MKKIAISFIEKIIDEGYEAYIVGGYVRNYLLGIDSKDIDVNTSATPKQIREIFKEACSATDNYGSVDVLYKGIYFDVTTFRKESSYTNNRQPDKVTYIKDLKEDLQRRDFTINTICLNKDSEIIDHLNGREDIKLKLIKSVGIADDKFREDALRILRAVRFAATLNFELTPDVVEAIKNNKHLLKNVSKVRKKEELDKIFTSIDLERAIDLLIDLELDKELGLKDLKLVHNGNTLIGIWSILNVVDIYPFTNNEKELIEDVNEVLGLDIFDPYTMYKYGLYVCSVAGEILNLDKKEITKKYDSLDIKSRKDIVLKGEDIIKLLDTKPGEHLKEIINDLELAILNKKITNEYNNLSSYLLEKYKIYE